MREESARFEEEEMVIGVRYDHVRQYGHPIIRVAVFQVKLAAEIR